MIPVLKLQNAPPRSLDTSHTCLRHNCKFQVGVLLKGRFLQTRKSIRFVTEDTDSRWIVSLRQHSESFLEALSLRYYSMACKILCSERAVVLIFMTCKRQILRRKPKCSSNFWQVVLFSLCCWQVAYLLKRKLKKLCFNLKRNKHPLLALALMAQ